MLLVWSPVSAYPQAYSGIVRDSRDSAAVAGASVRLLHNGKPSSSTVTDSLGRFRMPALPLPSQLIVERFGYSSHTLRFDESSLLPQPELPAIYLQPEVVRLDSVAAATQRICGGRPLSPQSAQLWMELQNALDGAERNRELSRTISFTAVEHVRKIDPLGYTMSSDSETVTIRGNRELYRSISPDSLLAAGFIQFVPLIDGYEYFGPDARVILSEPFLNAYCFTEESDRKRNLTGLGFQPVEHGVSSIRGVIWADAGSHELRAIEFSYHDLPFSDPRIEAGGRVEFRRLLNAFWFVSAWQLRTPRFVDVAEPGEPSELAFMGYRETARQVISAITEDGRRLW